MREARRATCISFVLSLLVTSQFTPSSLSVINNWIEQAWGSSTGSWFASRLPPGREHLSSCFLTFKFWSDRPAYGHYIFCEAKYALSAVVKIFVRIVLMKRPLWLGPGESVLTVRGKFSINTRPSEALNFFRLSTGDWDVSLANLITVGRCLQ